MPTIQKATFQHKNASYRAAGNIEVAEGQTLKVESSPGGEDIFQDTCPEGKHWHVNVILFIEEHDL